MKSGAAEYQEHMQYAFMLLTNALVYRLCAAPLTAIYVLAQKCYINETLVFCFFFKSELKALNVPGQ